MEEFLKLFDEIKGLDWMEILLFVINLTPFILLFSLPVIIFSKKSKGSRISLSGRADVFRIQNGIRIEFFRRIFFIFKKVKGVIIYTISSQNLLIEHENRRIKGSTHVITETVYSASISYQKKRILFLVLAILCFLAAIIIAIAIKDFVLAGIVAAVGLVCILIWYFQKIKIILSIAYGGEGRTTSAVVIRGGNCPKAILDFIDELNSTVRNAR